MPGAGDSGVGTVMLGLSLLLSVAASAVMLLTGVLLAQVLMALRRPGRPGGDALPAVPAGTLVVLVPAHNESAGVEPTLACIRAQLQAGDRCLVVADNCSDDTAERARQAGVEVVERQDSLRRGKGYALDFGLATLAAQASVPQVVVIVDADCLLAPDALAILRRRCLASGRPVQALYLMKLSGPAALGRRFAEFAWRVKNRVRPRGSDGLGWPCQLTGTGMAFPWDALRQVNLAHGDLVEDMRLGVELALAGRAPVFAEEALVWSHFPETAQAEASQRRRWEHGHLALIARLAPPLLKHGLVRRDLPALGMALDLAVPPLAFLVLTIGGLMGLTAGLALWGLPWHLPLGLAWVAAMALTLAVWLAWRGWGRDLLGGRELLFVPWYVLRKIPVYAGFWLSRQREWVRTDRQ